MKRQLTAALVAVGLSFGGGAPTPARAGSEDVALIVTGAIAVYALTQMFKDDDKKKSSTSYSRRDPPRYTPPSHSHGNGWGHDKKNRINWQADRLVPSQCYYRYSERGRMQGVFGQSCMASIMGSTRHLPETCRRSDGRQFSRAPAFDADCLRSRGYRVEARRQ